MRLSISLLFCLLPAAFAIDAAPPSTVATLYYQSLTSPGSKPVSLASLTLNPLSTSQLNAPIVPRTVRYEPLADLQSIPEGLIRVGVLDEKTGKINGAVLQGDIFRGDNAEGFVPVVRVRVDRFDKAYYVDVGAERGAAPNAILLRDADGPTPILAKPVVLDAEGKIPQKTEEKTFLQKYWWALLAAAVFVLAGGGGE